MTFARAEDRRVDTFFANLNGGPAETKNALAEHSYAFVVPAGRWRIRDLSQKGVPVNFCLGSPSFEAKAGEVVYAGSFDLQAEHFGVDPAPEPARAFLRDQPALAAKLTQAVWTNGATGGCGGSYIYALEFAGASSLDGYQGGAAPR